MVFMAERLQISPTLFAAQVAGNLMMNVQVPTFFAAADEKGALVRTLIPVAL